MLDKDRLKQAIATLDELIAGESLSVNSYSVLVKQARSLCAEILQADLDNEEAAYRHGNPDSIRKGLGNYLHRKSAFNGTGKEAFLKSCIPMVIQKALCEVSPEPDFKMAARKLCNEMWEENAG